jgi:hypothetical protein
MFPSPQNAFGFTNLFHLVLEIFRFFENHAQNLNTLQNNSVSWDMQMGCNSMFKGLKHAALTASCFCTICSMKAQPCSKSHFLVRI